MKHTQAVFLSYISGVGVASFVTQSTISASFPVKTIRVKSIVNSYKRFQGAGHPSFYMTIESTFSQNSTGELGVAYTGVGKQTIALFTKGNTVFQFAEPIQFAGLYNFIFIDEQGFADNYTNNKEYFIVILEFDDE